MRGDLARFVPEISNNKLLMCCCCGRFLEQTDFDLEHIIPRQTLKTDPPEVKANPASPANLRAKTILLCKKPLLYKNSPLYNNGCNSWKGRFFDGPITDILTGKAGDALQKSTGKKIYTTHIVASLMLGYLGLVAEFGYSVALMQSGKLLREQFFNPHKFLRHLGTRFQIVLMGEPFTDPNAPNWVNPFAFQFEDGACLVTIRNFVITAPMTTNPTQNFATHLKIVPVRYKLRPDFSTSFS